MKNLITFRAHIQKRSSESEKRTNAKTRQKGKAEQFTFIFNWTLVSISFLYHQAEIIISIKFHLHPEKRVK